MRVLVVSLVAAVAAVCIATPGTAASSPRLRVAGTQPLVVVGSAFRPGERVTLTAATPLGPMKVTTKAGRSGAFRATLRLYDRPCGKGLLVVAKGVTGNRAVLRLVSTPCIPPPID